MDSALINNVSQHMKIHQQIMDWTFLKESTEEIKRLTDQTNTVPANDEISEWDVNGKTDVYELLEMYSKTRRHNNEADDDVTIGLKSRPPIELIHTAYYGKNTNGGHVRKHGMLGLNGVEKLWDRHKEEACKGFNSPFISARVGMPNGQGGYNGYEDFVDWRRYEVKNANFTERSPDNGTTNFKPRQFGEVDQEVVNARPVGTLDVFYENNV